MSFSNTKSFQTQTDDSRPTLSEVADSRPPRGSGAPARTRTHYARILVLLRERGPAGVTSAELYDAPRLYGRSPRNRISELRAAGHLIKTLPAGASTVRYALLRENPSPIERPALRVVDKSSTTASALVPYPGWEGPQRCMFDLTVQP